ncbi:hypothetical protein OAO65_02195 [Flavobacteriales bacterium]|nr:hypothetical protein [Flavobacteriales bacterium]
MVEDENVILLQRQLETHIEEFQEHVKEEHERWDHLITVQEQNNTVQEQNNVAIAELTSSTKDLVEAWNTATGVVKAGATVGRFGKWVTSVAIFGVAISWLAEHWKG